ncbi:hypothetical protein LV84_02153 [Algoriphagus ratkowskyi]|uniref:Uncharacterized protein n=1 Tax=Algoriphagus ratkowskyi TaxID=57028 RepID=A0A2W7T1E9_9BACT|nr:hypothetical protein [Algoriphagus ratkowskyi]PZX57022.1 hypothetical protein LV84_02153 [Algoriphagus ratkowskyi]TXD79925.1 hypothetical protein ESW18_01980 [Algoriphagus ratkowskyi]
MKPHQLFTIFFIFLISCNSSPDYEQEIKNKIAEFYSIAEAKEYSPISFSELDTIQNLVDPGNGELIRLTGVIVHEFSAKANNGSIQNYKETFDVTIFKDAIIVLPKEK